jgi:hypothetical protein
MSWDLGIINIYASGYSNFLAGPKKFIERLNFVEGNPL